MRYILLTFSGLLLFSAFIAWKEKAMPETIILIILASIAITSAFILF